MNRRAWRTALMLFGLTTGCTPARMSTADDAEIYAVVLEEFAARDDTMLMGEGTILIAPQSKGSVPEQTRLPSEIDAGRCKHLAALHAELLRRNAVDAPIASAIAPTPKWRIASKQELETPFYMQYKTTRTIVRFKQPAISADRAKALLSLRFLWSEHAADATYVLERRDGDWRIACSELQFYL